MIRLVLTRLAQTGLRPPRWQPGSPPLGVASAALVALICVAASTAPADGIGLAGAAATSSSSDALELVGQVGGAAWSGAVYADSALIGVGPRIALARLPSVDEPDSLFYEVGRSTLLPHLVTSVAVSDGIAYASMYDWGVALVDLAPAATAPDGPDAEPVELPVLGQAYMLGDIGSIAVRDSTAYVAAAHDGVRVVDATDPRAPREVPFSDVPEEDAGLGYARDVAVAGDLLLVACGGSYDRPAPGLRVFDLAGPGPPIEVADLTTPGEAESVAADGRWAYVVHAGPEDNDRQALWVVDLSEPDNPNLAFELLLTDLVWDLVVDGDLLYIAADEYGVLTYDVSDPGMPRLLGFVGAGLAQGVLASEQRLIVFTGGGPVRAFDMRTPREPRQMQAYHTVGHSADVARLGADLLVAEWSHWPGGALRVLDAADTDHPALAHSEYQEQWQESVAGAPGAAYLGGYDDVLRVFALSEDSQPSLTSAIGAGGAVTDLAVAGGLVHATLAVGRSGALWIVDPGDPAEPTELSRLLIGDAAFGLHVADERAYVAASDAGLLIVDITDSTEPLVVGSLDGFGQARGVAVSGGHAFVATYDSGLAVVDVTEPEAPRLVAQLPHQLGMGSAHDITTDGSTAYVAATETGVAVVDIRRPSQPVLVATHDTPGVAWSVLIDGDRLHVADEAGGVLTFRRLPPGPMPTAGPTGTATPHRTATPTTVATTTATPTPTSSTPATTLHVPVASNGVDGRE